MLRLFVLQYLKIRWVINICLLKVIARYTCFSLCPVIVFLSTTNNSFHYVLLLIITTLYLSHKFRINSFVLFCNTMFFYIQVHLRPFENFDHQHKADIERRGCIKGWLIVVRKIMTLIYIVCLQLFLGNTLL